MKKKSVNQEELESAARHLTAYYFAGDGGIEWPVLDDLMATLAESLGIDLEDDKRDF